MFDFLKDRSILIASAIYLCLTFFLLWQSGMNTNGEAIKVLNDAQRILSGEPFDTGIFGFFYITYSLLLAVFSKFGINLIFLGVIQILLSYFAAVYLYKTLLRVTANKGIAFFSFVILLFCFPVQKWNLFVYTEAIHTHLTVIGFCLFLDLLRNASLKNTILFVIITALIMTSRPVGIIFCLSCFCTLICYYYLSGRRKSSLVLLSLGILCFVILLNSPFRYFINPDSLRRMEVICMVPTAGKEIPYTEYNKSGLRHAAAVIKYEIGIGTFLILGLKKLGYFFGLVKPYFSLKNNLFLALYLLLYPFAAFGLFFYRHRWFAPIRIFCLCYILITAFGVFLTCTEWSNRFIAPVFPFIIIAASAGISMFYKRITGKVW